MKPTLLYLCLAPYFGFFTFTFWPITGHFRKPTFLLARCTFASPQLLKVRYNGGKSRRKSCPSSFSNNCTQDSPKKKGRLTYKDAHMKERATRNEANKTNETNTMWEGVSKYRSLMLHPLQFLWPLDACSNKAEQRFTSTSRCDWPAVLR